jgi:hypothetical protein
MSRKVFGALSLAVVVSTWALAGDRTPKIPSSVVEKRVAKLTQKIDWLSSLEEAKARATEQKKPIFWLHALGDLDGIC